MSKEQYHIKKIGPQEFDLLVPLVKNSFGMDVDINYFKWKYVENPAGDFIGFVAVHKETGEVGAYYGVIPQLFFVNGEEKVIYQSCDTMTHSEHRRRGLFQMLALHCFDYLRQQNKLFIYGFGGGNSTPGFIKFGWLGHFRPVYIFFPRQFLPLSSLLKGGGAKTVKIERMEQLAGLLENSNSKVPVHSMKKVPNFSWRISNPLRKYEVIGIEEGGAFKAYAVYYKQYGKIFLFDWYGADPKSEKQVINAVKAELRKDKAMRGIVSFVKPGGSYFKSLKKQLFFTNPFSFGPLQSDTTFITFAHEAPGFSSGENWDTNPYDHDAY